MNPKSIQKILDQYIPHASIPLKHQDAYTLLIAVLLSAQCTDERVNQISPLLFTRADTPEKMVQLSVADIKAIIHPCGLGNTKAKAIHALSKRLIEDFDSQVPANLSDLESLPGVGHKTASVVMVQAFHKPAFPVDTHIFRCAKRWGLSKGTTVSRVENDLKTLFPQKSWGKLHLQIILFARKYCTARAHNPISCPICSKL